MPFTTFIQCSRLAVKHLEVVTFHGSTIQNNILGLDFGSVVIHCSLNTQMAKTNGIKIQVSILYLTLITNKCVRRTV